MPVGIKYIDIHTHKIYSKKHILSIYNLTDINKSSEIINKCEYISAGLHPWYIHGNFSNSLKSIKNISCNKKIIAIGECGIDKIKGPNLEIQNEVFESQIVLSEEIKKPLIIHAVKSYDEILYFHKKHRPQMSWIIHGFNGNEEQAKLFTKKKIYLSIGEILFNKNSRLRKSIKKLNPAFLLFETDESKKGIEEIYSLYCKLSDISKEEISTRIKENFYNCFNYKIWD